jgi:thiopurine S-methyltransferase
MEASFWHQKWEKGEIGFHKSEANPLLIKHFEKLKLVKGNRVFLPLCGKTRDFGWLLSCGYQVVGAELSDRAVNELFDELEVEPTISRVGELMLYHAQDIDIWVGDIFDVSAEVLGLVNAVYDQAALVAMSANKRDEYTSHLIDITDAVPQLLICYEYDQQLMEGLPFSIHAEEVKRYYAANYQLQAIESNDVVGGLKGVATIETVWLLQKAK